MTDSISQMPSTIYRGLAAAPGMTTGPVHRRRRIAATVTTAPVDPLSALHDAFHTASRRLETARAQADATLAPLLHAQQLMLDDPDLRDGAVQLTERGLAPADAVVQMAGQLAAMLEAADSSYFRERAIDVRAVGVLVAEILSGDRESAVPQGAVVVAEELAPLDTARLIDAGVVAFVTVRGGPTCHAAIIARAWGIPAVVGMPDTILDLADGTPLLVDGDAGTVTTFPREMPAPPSGAALPAASIARRVPIYANIGSPGEATRALAFGAEGIGLLRTELLFKDRDTPPDEDEQTELYTAIVREMDGRPVTIRTLDIGADKPVPFLPLPVEANPQLGLRGIRLCLQYQELFRTQLRALLRASVAGPLNILLPMVTTDAEVREVRAMLHAMAGEMHLAVPPLGAMIEVPMAALAAQELAAVCDFFSLGTNDLLQFLLAADRQHAGVGYLHLGEHPGVWRLLAQVMEAAQAAGIPVGVCGEWGTDAEKLARLVELGIHSVSVATGALPRVQAMFV